MKLESYGSKVPDPLTQESVEQKEKGVEITFTKETASVLFHNLNLSSENPISPEIGIVVEKQPIELVEGKSYCNEAVLVDKETERMQALATQAEVFLELPENERPAKVLELLRDKMHYAYNDVVEELSKTNPDLGKWVVENTGPNTSSVHNIPLSEIIEKGYGVCRHLSPAYLWLAQKAGLKGVLLSSIDGIKNIERSDTKQKLFKFSEIGKPVGAHSWVEIKTSDGQWIPVDPSTKLVGDSEEGLAMFREANYMALGGPGLEIGAEPRDQLNVDATSIFFAPAEATASGKYSLELQSLKPTVRFGKENLPPTNVPYSGEGKLTVNTREQSSDLTLDIVEVKMESEK